MDFNIESRWFVCDVVPTEFTEFTEFVCDVVPTEFMEFVCVLLICEYLCHLWEDIFRWTVLCVLRVLWGIYSAARFCGRSLRNCSTDVRRAR